MDKVRVPKAVDPNLHAGERPALRNQKVKSSRQYKNKEAWQRLVGPQSKPRRVEQPGYETPIKQPDISTRILSIQDSKWSNATTFGGVSEKHFEKHTGSIITFWKEKIKIKL